MIEPLASVNVPMVDPVPPANVPVVVRFSLPKEIAPEESVIEPVDRLNVPSIVAKSVTRKSSPTVKSACTVTVPGTSKFIFGAISLRVSLER